MNIDAGFPKRNLQKKDFYKENDSQNTICRQIILPSRIFFIFLHLNLKRFIMIETKKLSSIKVAVAEKNRTGRWLGVNEKTIRRDLDDLKEKGIIARET